MVKGQLMDLLMLGAFEDEMSKIASAKSALIGAAVGGGLKGYQNVQKELERRPIEDYHPDKALVATNRKKRLGRMAASTALSAGAGAILGHAGERGYSALKNKAPKAFEAAKSKAKELGGAAGAEARGELEKLDVGKVMNDQKVKEIGDRVGKDLKQRIPGYNLIKRLTKKKE